MSPKELRAFRERLGLSRREFAPKLFISEPTLERWERGQGGPGKVHLQILRRMREHLSAGHSLAYFEYDAGAEARAAETRNDERRMIVETLEGLGALVLDEKESRDGADWSVSFGMGWAVSEPSEVSLRCEGSHRPERPAIDFALEIETGSGDVTATSEAVESVCRDHSVFGEVGDNRKGGMTITLRHRLFTTGCNPRTVAHVAGNFRSCWQRLKDTIERARLASPETGTDVASSVESGAPA